MIFISNIHIHLGMCTGNFQEEGKRPPAGTPCVGTCVMETGIWGSSYCYTDSDKNQWGAECVSCQSRWGGECVSCQGLKFEEHLRFFIDHKVFHFNEITFRLKMPLSKIIRSMHWNIQRR